MERKTFTLILLAALALACGKDDGDGATTKPPIEIETVAIPAGTFTMGSSSEPDRWTNEIPHQVTLTKAFRMGKYEVTCEQYAAFLNAKGVSGEACTADFYAPVRNTIGGKCTWGANAGQVMVYDSEDLDPDGWGGVKWNAGVHQWEPTYGFNKHPVINVTWFGAYEFARWAGGRLPTEAEWEYACRAGKTGPFGVGDGTKLDHTMAFFDHSRPYELPGGEYRDYGRIAPEFTAQVGQYPANAWGLHDMHGNVLEWCNDWYYGPGEHLDVTDPQGPETGEGRVARGGSFFYQASYCRSAYRMGNFPDHAGYAAGFRIVYQP